MSFSATEAGGASEKVPHTEFWFLKTVKNDGFYELKKRVLQVPNPMEFKDFVGEMSTLYSVNTEIKNALDNLLRHTMTSADFHMLAKQARGDDSVRPMMP
eukprot:CAMPEP_0198133532 /NCGR_PEP_ID=MMETSP1442-20131203/59614_1 /TAXON_ID= /ORGANISM="Craspedostauros australis, Strain CCMP3328" /LENGTH=99 /DNA_ID=CAMNT_0043794655 /DNA_START=708 /DNA_END=1007 /DNA_ORIENTATION=+